MINAHIIDVQIDERFLSIVEVDWLERVVETTIASQNIEKSVEVSLLITDDETVQGLNCKYRGIDSTTDVLAFALQEAISNEEPEGFMPSLDDVCCLGDVIVSHPQAMKQAQEHGHPVGNEVALLVIHGVLHLLGYDHDTPSHEGQMRDIETKVLSTISDLDKKTRLP